MDLSERRDVALLAREARIASMQDANVVRDIMSSAHGRAWMLRKLEFCHIFVTSFAPNANQSAFNEGQRSVGLMILADIMSYCPEQYILMMQERSSHDAARSAAAERTRGEDAGGRDQEREYALDGAEGSA